MDNNEINNMPIARKSNVLNIIIIVLVLALVVVFFVSKNKDDNKDPISSENASSTPSDVEVDITSTTAGVPMPVGDWTTGSVKNEITFDVPPSYYVSYPVIGECEDVVSISTQTSGAPSVPIALIYKDGCVTDSMVTGKYVHREVKNGYVFQTNSTNSTVLELFNRIVTSAK